MKTTMEHSERFERERRKFVCISFTHDNDECKKIICKEKTHYDKRKKS